MTQTVEIFVKIYPTCDEPRDIATSLKNSRFFFENVEVIDGETYLSVCFENDDVEIIEEYGDGWHSPHCETYIEGIEELDDIETELVDLLPDYELNDFEFEGDTDEDVFYDNLF